MRARMIAGVWALLALIAEPSCAKAECKLTKFAELPVTMDEAGPMVDAKINGKPVRFIADSGAFYSVISPGSARSLKLATRDRPLGFYMAGINGSAAVSLATVTFTLAGIDIPKVIFIVAGSDVGGVGVIGQNVLGMHDVEYDLPHGVIRLILPDRCEKSNLAYWASERPYAVIATRPRTPEEPHTVGTVTINGKPVRATFDTGAETSILSLAAAARIGLKPGGPDVVDGGTVWGFGRNTVRTWIGPVGTFAMGEGEQIQHARIRFGALPPDTEMLIGADFFIAHRVYVDNKAHRLFLTYEGGPIFNIKAHFDGPKGAGSASAQASGAGTGIGTATAAAAAPATADGYSRSGAVALARRDPDAAIADFTKAIALAPGEARYRFQRATAYFAHDQRAAGRADLDRAIALDPAAAEARLARTSLILESDDRSRAARNADALQDLDAVNRSVDAAAMERLALGSLLTHAGQPERAVGQYDQWIKAHPDDFRRPAAINGRCWARALAGKDLDVALRDCDAALRERPGEPSILDSRALVRLRRGEWAKAIVDYDAALAKQPKLSWSLYGRGIAKLRTGEAAGGKADIDAAIALDPHIAEIAGDAGIAP